MNTGEWSEKLVSIWKHLHTEVSWASVVCLEFPFLNQLAFLLWVCPVCKKTTVCKIMLCNNPEVPSNSIRLERLTMTHKIPDTHTKVRSQRESRSPMDAQRSCQLTRQVRYGYQTSFLLGTPWLVSVKVSAPLFRNNLNMNDKAWIQQKLSFIFLWFNIKLTWRKALGYAFKILTSDFFFFFNSITMSSLNSIILLKKAERKGCWTSTEKIYSTKHSTVQETPVSQS